MSYNPKVHDYVIWKNGIEGWVYFKSNQYVTIEVLTRPKDPENYAHSSIHRNERLLILCYSNQWKELTYSHTRIHEVSSHLLYKQKEKENSDLLSN